MLDMLRHFTLEMAVIGAVRVLGSLPVLRWAAAGAVIAILTDLSDLFLMNLLSLGGVYDYQSFDKLFDQVYMATFLVVALRWVGTERTIAVALYLYRLAGVLLFEATGNRSVLLVFPNLFEFWFVFVAFSRHWRPGTVSSPAYAGSTLAGLLIFKEGQEWVIHQGRLLDSFTAVEAVQAIWRWLTPPY